MPDLSSQTHCYFCRDPLNPGQGRYRFFQDEEEIECCPSCFDRKGAFPPIQFDVAAGVRTADEPGKRRTDGSRR